MSEVDWSKAPSWATKLMERTTDKGVYIWADSIEYRYTNNSRIHKFSDTTVVFKLVEMRPNKWQEGEERMNNIGTNGNEGEHYDAVNHPEHYQSESGIECIDAIRASLGLDGFVAYCRGNAIKYAWRSGKKANHAEDLRKAAWYLEKAASELDK